MTSVAKKVFVVDDHALVRRGMRDLISQESEFTICGEAAGMTEALRLIEASTPDIVIVDITLGDGDGIELIKQIRARNIPARIIVSTMHDESLFGERCFRAGAMGYVNKEVASERVVEAMRTVIAGRLYVSERLAERLLNRAVGSDSASPKSLYDGLTDRELEVFGMIGKGMTTREIADKLHRSHKTIESYRENIKFKLGLKNSAELARSAVEWVLRPE